MSRSLNLAREYLGKTVEVVVDRPLGSKHPEHGLVYDANYGYIPGTKAPDGEELDAYYLGVSTPVKKAKGRCVAIVHRLDSDDDKLVVVPEGVVISDAQIVRNVKFQEQWFDFEILR
jgi:inorganic pyrophosphatase